MYHYVRPIKNSKYSHIKGLDLDGFINQLNYFKKNFTLITVQQLLNATYQDVELPERSILLTFDDGFKDHYLHVFPILEKLSVQGAFFPPAEPIERKKVLDVHKIQFILASCDNKHEIVSEIFSKVDYYRTEYGLDSPQQYFSKLATYDRFDTKEVVFIKRILQRDLPRKIRSEIVNYLFEKFVHVDEASFASDLYLSLDEMKEMIENGMYFGSHGYSHEWLSNLSSIELELELKKSLEFYLKINKKPTDLIMCYPYGDYNDLVIKKIKELGFKAGLTTEVGDAELIQENAFRIRRYDTNDFPK